MSSPKLSTPRSRTPPYSSAWLGKLAPRRPCGGSARWSTSCPSRSSSTAWSHSRHERDYILRHALNPSLFPTRFEERLPQYKARWTNELSDHVAGDPPQFEELLRAVRRTPTAPYQRCLDPTRARALARPSARRFAAPATAKLRAMPASANPVGEQRVHDPVATGRVPILDKLTDVEQGADRMLHASPA